MVLTRPDRDRLVALLKNRVTDAFYGSAGAALVRTMNTAMVVEPMAVPANVITMNSIVSLIDITNGTVTKCALVYPIDANVDKLKVSVLAPLGAALLGRSEGEIVEFEGPAGPRKYFIQKVAYQPESRFRDAPATGAQ